MTQPELDKLIQKTRLRSRMTEALRLHLVEGKSLNEAARQVGCSKDAIWRAKRRLMAVES